MTMRALGRDAVANLDYALFSFQEAGQASAHDVRIGHEIAVRALAAATVRRAR